MFRRVFWVVSSTAWVLAGACSTSYEAKDVFPAKPGLVVPDASGQAMSEAAACSALVSALGNARTRLGCTSGDLPACPGYVRPPGGRQCAEYDQGSVEGCVAVIDSLTSCADLESRRCIVTVLASRDPACEEEPVDAGTDATDASDAGADASRDGATDAASDAASDAARDAARDAPAG
jgi:hypothetical protein